MRNPKDQCARCWARHGKPCQVCNYPLDRVATFLPIMRGQILAELKRVRLATHLFKSATTVEAKEHYFHLQCKYLA